MPERLVEHHAPELVGAVLVEEILQFERPPTLIRIGRVEGRIRPAKLELLNYPRRVADSGPIDIDYGERGGSSAQHARTNFLQPGEDGPSLMRDPLVIQSPACLLVEMRDVEVPEGGYGH